ncbi:MAG: FG-GAP repeat domain-containing protein [Phycisphaerales bacterium]
MNAQRIGPLVCVLCLGCAFGSATRQPEFCLPDADGDGHPMFGNPTVRTGFEVYDGLTSYATARAVAAAFGDMDGDGDPDAVVINVNPHNQANPKVFFLTVLLNHGDGVFDPAQEPYPVGWEGTDVALGDLDGDMDLDAAVPNARDNTVSILFNNGDGTLAPHVTYPVGSMPRCLRIADLDDDRDPDLVVLNTVSNDVSILLNTRDGTFAPEVRVFVGNVSPRGDPNLNFAYPGPFLAVGDLNGDGHPDIAVPCKTQVRLLFNNGSGGFALAASHPAVAFPNAYSVVIADLDGDFKPDLAATSLYGGSVGGPNCLSVMRNLGSGVFAPTIAYNAGWSNSLTAVQWATSLTVGDIDGDTDLDLVVGHEVTNAPVLLLRNRGDGTFDPKQEIKAGQGPWHVRLADLNTDGRLDLGVTSGVFAARSVFTALLNNGAGSLTTYARYPSVLEPCCQNWKWLEGADLDGDGDTDLVATMTNSEYAYHVRVLLNDGRGAFDTIHSYALGPVGTATGESVAIGDLNGDTVPDLVVCDAIVPGGFSFPGKVWTMMGRGDGTFEPPTPYHLDGFVPKQAAIADFDDDGNRDLAVWAIRVYPGNDITPVERTIVMFWNKGQGSFTPGELLVVGTTPWPFSWGSVAALDLDRNGTVDIVATSGTKSVPGRMVTFVNQGRRTFHLQQIVIVDPQPEFLRIVRPGGPGSAAELALLFNHNYLLEKVYSHPYLNVWSVDARGRLVPHLSLVDERTITHGRFDSSLPKPGQSGRFAIADVVQRALIVDASASATPTGYGVGYWPSAVVLGDFDRDGRVDLAASVMADRSASVLLNRACRSCYGDCDGDGALTLADFACFQVKYLRADPYADCNHDARFSVADFGCFQTKFVAGCP